MTRVDRRPRPARDAASFRGARAISLSLCLALGLLLPACGGDDEPGESPSVAGSTGAEDASTAGPYLPVPEGVELTDPGSELSLGEQASVAWQPRESTTGVLGVTVRAVERAPLSVFSGFRLDKQTRQSAAYFVRVRITNAGESNLSGIPIPLYLVDEANTLIQASSFASSFPPCPSRPFPRGFRPGESLATCLVYLAPDKGGAEAVSFRPSQAFDPIIWTGKQTRYDAGS